MSGSGHDPQDDSMDFQVGNQSDPQPSRIVQEVMAMALRAAQQKAAAQQQKRKNDNPADLTFSDP